MSEHRTNEARDVVFSTRIRFARNCKEYPFAAKLDRTSAAEIIEKVTRAAGDDYIVTDMQPLSAAEAARLVERHRVSREFLSVTVPHILLEHKTDNVAIMVCEEDHIRLQSFAVGFDLQGAYRAATAAEAALSAKLHFAFDEKLGYLTHCPTNLGTGMRASVMLFLPALTRTGRLGRLMGELQNLGMTVRGMYGEGTDASGALYQISNRQTLGVREEALLEKLTTVVERLITLEREAREALLRADKNALADAAGRAYGICRYATEMSSGEFLKHYTDLRLGVALGLFDGVSLAVLDALLFDTMPASIALWAKTQTDSPRLRDTARAEKLRKTLSDCNA